MIAYWHGVELASVGLTNIRDGTRLGETFDPRRPEWLARPRRGRVGWRKTALRGRRAWEHHLAIVCAWRAYQLEKSFAYAGTSAAGFSLRRRWVPSSKAAQEPLPRHGRLRGTITGGSMPTAGHGSAVSCWPDHAWNLLPTA